MLSTTSGNAERVYRMQRAMREGAMCGSQKHVNELWGGGNYELGRRMTMSWNKSNESRSHGDSLSHDSYIHRIQQAAPLLSGGQRQSCRTSGPGLRTTMSDVVGGPASGPVEIESVVEEGRDHSPPPSQADEFAESGESEEGEDDEFAESGESGPVSDSTSYSSSYSTTSSSEEEGPRGRASKNTGRGRASKNTGRGRASGRPPSSAGPRVVHGAPAGPRGRSSAEGGPPDADVDESTMNPPPKRRRIGDAGFVSSLDTAQQKSSPSRKHVSPRRPLRKPFRALVEEIKTEERALRESRLQSWQDFFHLAVGWSRRGRRPTDPFFEALNPDDAAAIIRLYQTMLERDNRRALRAWRSFLDNLRYDDRAKWTPLTENHGGCNSAALRRAPSEEVILAERAVALFETRLFLRSLSSSGERSGVSEDFGPNIGEGDSEGAAAAAEQHHGVVDQVSAGAGAAAAAHNDNHQTVSDCSKNFYGRDNNGHSFRHQDQKFLRSIVELLRVDVDADSSEPHIVMPRSFSAVAARPAPKTTVPTWIVHGEGDMISCRPWVACELVERALRGGENTGVHRGGCPFFAFFVSGHHHHAGLEEAVARSGGNEGEVRGAVKHCLAEFLQRRSVRDEISVQEKPPSTADASCGV